jgi:hypothetical protein
MAGPFDPEFAQLFASRSDTNAVVISTVWPAVISAVSLTTGAISFWLASW